MKNFPGTRVFVLTLAAVVVILVIQACAHFQLDLQKGKFILIISFPQQIKSLAEFEKTLTGLQKPGVEYHFRIVFNRGGMPKVYDYKSPVAIKTDRVIVTELAQGLSKEELTPIGTSLSHKLSTTDPADIAAVLKQIKKDGGG